MKREAFGRYLLHQIDTLFAEVALLSYAACRQDDELSISLYFSSSCGCINRFWRAKNCSRFQFGTRSRLFPMSVVFFDCSILRSISFTFQSLLSIFPIARSKSFGFFSTTGAVLPSIRCSIDRTRSLN
uniref:Uncharacterized protein n=1 Tax=Anopheles maculatus TaxID=74869 RepID=A0A182SJR6_9DIPT